MGWLVLWDDGGIGEGECVGIVCVGFKGGCFFFCLFWCGCYVVWFVLYYVVCGELDYVKW